MPIDKQVFIENKNFSKSNESFVLDLLKQNSNKAFTLRELCDELKLSITDCSNTLGRLKFKGLVSHKRPYWIIKEASE